MKERSFVHLHTHSQYSLLDGMSKFDEMITVAKETGMPAIGLTDHGALFVAIELYQACTKAGVKPIIGVEAYIANRTRHDKEHGIDNRRYHLTLLAQNFTGYQNLMKLVTAANLEGYYYKPRMDKDLLRQYHEGIICLSGCLGGELARALQYESGEKAREVALEYQSIFGKENYFIEIMHKPEIEGHDDVEKRLIALAKELKIPMVATQDSHYCHEDQKTAHGTLLAINTGNESGDALTFECDASFITPEKAYEMFAHIPEAVENTVKIAERCNLELTLGKFIFPNFPLPPGKDADTLLRDLAMEGMKKRGLDKKKEALERLDYELGIIKFKGYANYFLVVEDLIRYAHENGILTNIRGSVAGSMTTYSLFITSVDPLEYNIPFERFLNPERPSAPDIDMDFADDKREIILNYAKSKYGADKVAQIGTFGTMMARGTVRDVARAMGKPYDLGDRIAKLIPMGSQGFPMTIEHAMELEPDLAKLYKSDLEVKEIIDTAEELEGTVRHVSVHAAGVVIAPKPLVEYTPLQFDPKGGKLITQYDMYTVGEDGVGLTKFDFLGIRNLTILAEAVKLVKRHRNIDVDIEHIPLDDKKTFAMLARGETIGLFQLNGSGMTKWLKELRPSTIHDINAMVALYRPGPMQFIPDYIKRKHDPSLISYLDPALEPILRQTYGILVYQDDLLIMANKLAGYSWGEVDKFRKAVGKKIPEEMAKQKEKFIHGCVEHAGWSEKKATEIWAWIEPFAAYGFNKAHSASYGRVAYQTAYMKANFPSEYMTAVLTAESGDVEMVAEIIAECKHLKIPVLPPDINESFGDFTTIKGVVEKEDSIRFGLSSIKNLGEGIAEFIIAEREKKGKFKGYADFLERVSHRNLNKKSLEALIKAGALDSLGEDRGKMLHNIEVAIDYNKEHAKKSENQDSLFGDLDTSAMPKLRLRISPEVPARERLAWEKELLGLYISGHPLDEWKSVLDAIGTTIRETVENAHEGVEYILAGIIEEFRPVMTKKGDHMAFIRLGDFTGSIEAVIFPKTLAEVKDAVGLDRCVKIKGRFSKRNDEPSIVVERLKALDKTPASPPPPPTNEE